MDETKALPSWLVSLAQRLGHSCDLGTYEVDVLSGGVGATAFRLKGVAGGSGEIPVWVYKRTRLDYTIAEQVPAALELVGSQAPRNVMPPDLTAFADRTEGLLTAYRWVAGRLGRVSVDDYRRLGEALGRLHQLRGFPRTPSFVRHFIAEAEQARRADSARVRRAAARLAGVGSSVGTSLMDNRSIATHGDVKLDNTVFGSHGLTLIDWEKCLSCSPEFEVSVAIFDASAEENAIEAISAFAVRYLDLHRDFELSLLERAIEVIGDLYLVHTWYRSGSSATEAAERGDFMSKFVIPRCRRWESIQTEVYGVWKGLRH